MDREEKARPKTRMIHIRLPEDLHKKVRIRAAESDKTIQDWAVDAIRDYLNRQGELKGE
jgi:plasmid stability protein